MSPECQKATSACRSYDVILQAREWNVIDLFSNSSLLSNYVYCSVGN